MLNTNIYEHSLNTSCVLCIYYCSPCVFISIRVHNRQDVDVQVIQDVSDVLVLAIKGQRLWVEQKFNERTF